MSIFATWFALVPAIDGTRADDAIIPFRSRVDCTVDIGAVFPRSKLVAKKEFLGRTFAENDRSISIPAKASWFAQPSQIDPTPEQWLTLLADLRKLNSAGLTMEGINKPAFHLTFKIPDKVLDEFQRCPTITRLRLRITGESLSRELQYVQKLVSLQSLDCSGTRIEHQGLLNISEMTQLLHLDVSRTPLDDESIPTIARLKSLESLDISHTKISGRLLKELVEFPRLTSLHITGMKASAAELKEITKIRGLQTLDLSETPADDQFLQAIKTHQTLSAVSLGGTAVTDCEVAKTVRASKWVSIGLDRTTVGRETFAAFGAVNTSGVVSLSVSDCPNVNDESFSGFKALSNLVDLDLSRSKVSDKTIQLLANAGKLQVLGLAGTNITDIGAAHLGNCKALRILDISETSISTKGIGAFSLCAEIEYLNLSGLTLVSGLANALGTRQKLKGLILLDAKFNSDDLVKILQSCPSIESLSLSKTTITDRVLVACAKLRNLRELDIIDCSNVTALGIGELSRCKSLSHLSSLSKSGTAERVAVDKLIRMFNGTLAAN